MCPAANLSKPCQLLDGYPLSRSRSVTEASALVGRALSPHQLHVRSGAAHFEARHNQIHLGQVALNVLSYGAEVEIDPGERGDYYLLQLPLQGRARVSCNGQEAWVGPNMMSVLQPRAQTRMVWTGDCAMIMLQVPSQALSHNVAEEHPLPAFNLARSRLDPAVAAWWQAVTDLTRNLHSHGAQWLRHPAAFGAMEAFLLSGLDLLRPPSLAPQAPSILSSPGNANRLQRAVDHINAHVHQALSLTTIAAAACMSPRALEAGFRRRYDTSPLAYARQVRLTHVHLALQLAAREGRSTSLTDVALQHGFVHMGRFAAYYKQYFGCSPSVTLRGHLHS
jgi:AraC-like DNA-binding protein